MTTYNFDLEKLKVLIDGKSYTMPDNMRTLEEFTEWMKSIAEKDEDK